MTLLRPKSTMAKAGYVYIMASGKYGTLYIGVTSDLAKRVWQHRGGHIKGFTSSFDVKQLVYYELCDTIETAIIREKALKKWRRQWKINAIEKFNPDWDDLYDVIAN